MDTWFEAIAAGRELSAVDVRTLRDVGFIVVPGPVASDGLAQIAAAYDSAVASASGDDVSRGRTTTRVHDLVNRGPEFPALFVYAPILEACCHLIGQPFKLSAMLARTVNSNSTAQGLHVDFPPESAGWPMVGFILMVDEFRSENGATRFVPGSHLWPRSPDDSMQNPTEDDPSQVSACGPAGSIIVYNGSVWHGHAANRTSQPRRSIQGAFIRRDAQAAMQWATRMRSESLNRMGRLAKYLLDL